MSQVQRRLFKPPFWAANRAEVAPEYRGLWDGLLLGVPFLGGSDLQPVYGTLAHQRVVTAQNTLVSKAGPCGLVVGPSANDYLYIDNKPSWARPLTIYCSFEYDSVTQGAGVLYSIERDTPNEPFVFSLGTAFGNSVYFGSVDTRFKLDNISSSYCENKRSVVVVEYNGDGEATASNFRIWVDGVEYGTTTVARLTTLDERAGIHLLSDRSNGMEGRMEQFAMWQGEHASKVVTIRDPFGMFRRARRISVVVPAPVVAATVYSGSVSMTGSGTITTTSAAIRPATSSMTGSGTVTAAATAIKAATVTMTGSGTVTAAASAIRTASSAMTGTGTVTATASAIRPATISMTGSGTLTSSATVVTTTISGTAAMTGAGTLTAQAVAIRPASAALSGSGTITVASAAIRPATSSMTGAATLTSSATVVELAVVRYNVTNCSRVRYTVTSTSKPRYGVTV